MISRVRAASFSLYAMGQYRFVKLVNFGFQTDEKNKLLTHRKKIQTPTEPEIKTSNTMIR